MNTVTLRSDSLFSKWGFSDGDILDDWGFSRYDMVLDSPRLPPEHELYDYDFEHALLIRLVENHLLPLCPRTIKTYRMSSIHNPIRAEDGEEQDFYVEVVLTYDQIDAASEALLVEVG